MHCERSQTDECLDLDNLEDETASQRNKTFARWKQQCREQGLKNAVETINLKEWHRIFESLFRFVDLERSVYVKSLGSRKPAQSKSSHFNNLAGTASVLRDVVELAVSKIQIKTAKAIVEHIVQSIQSPDGGLLAPVALDYTKSLRCVLAFQPHVEHLRHVWNNVLHFCIKTLSDLQDGLSQDDVEADSFYPSMSKGPAGTPFDRSSTAASRTSSQSKALENPRTIVQDLLLCVSHLLQAPNAPLDGESEYTVKVLLNLLPRLAKSTGRSSRDCLAAVNLILGHISYTKLDLAQRALLDLLQVLPALWHEKSSTALKEEVLKSLIQADLHIRSLLKRPMTALATRSSLEKLYELFYSDYTAQNARKQLQLDDLFLGLSNESPKAQGLAKSSDGAKFVSAGAPPWTSSMNQVSSMFTLRRGHTAAEVPWSMVHFLALWSHQLDQPMPANVDPEPEVHGTRRKRIRLSTYFDEILLQVKSSAYEAKLAALQILSFRCQMFSLEEHLVHKLLDALIPQISELNGLVSSWIMLAISR